MSALPDHHQRPARGSNAQQREPNVRRPGRPRDAGADRAILEATWAEVAVHGLGGLSVDKVAARCGFSKATIYRRWPTKEALVLDAWAAAEEDLVLPDTGTLVGDLEAMHQQFELQKLHAPLAILLPQMVAARQQNPDLAIQFQEFIEQQRQPLRDLLTRARSRGEIRVDVELEAIVSAISGPFLMALLFDDRPMTLDNGRAMIDLILRGIAVPD